MNVPTPLNCTRVLVVEVDANAAGLSRDELMHVLHADNVLARRYFYPGCHRMEPYRSFFPHAHLMLPQTEELVKRVLILPTGMAVTPQDIACVCCIIRVAIEHSEAVKKALANEQFS